MTLWIFIALLFIPRPACAEFDVKVGDVYWHDNGTPSIVIQVSEDKGQIITSAALYKEREAEQKATENAEESMKARAESAHRQHRRDQIMEEILYYLRLR